MKFTKHILSVSTLALAVTGAPAFANNSSGATASDPVYNTATVMNVQGTVASVQRVPAGNPLAGLHLTVNSEAGAFDVYVGPSDFLRFLRVRFRAGDRVEIIGSKVELENADVILTREVNEGRAQLTLRDANGVAAWESWAKEIDPADVE
ncbi:MAG TPA: hypothetical protein VGR73_13370 [Bryobacteraceae bacterium]|nr:hypothetical protein [Bryobacteraceae bacterium]